MERNEVKCEYIQKNIIFSKNINMENKKERRQYLLSFIFAWRRPTLTRGNPSLPSALRSLTSEFGMCSGVTFSPSSPHNIGLLKEIILSKLDNERQPSNIIALSSFGS